MPLFNARVARQRRAVVGNEQQPRLPLPASSRHEPEELLDVVAGVWWIREQHIERRRPPLRPHSIAVLFSVDDAGETERG